MTNINTKNFITRKRALKILTEKGIISSLKKIEIFEKNFLTFLPINIFSNKVMTNTDYYDLKYLEENYVKLYYYYTNHDFLKKIFSITNKESLNFINTHNFIIEFGNFLQYMDVSFEECNKVQHMFLSYANSLHTKFSELNKEINSLTIDQSIEHFNSQIKSLNEKRLELKNIEFDVSTSDFVFLTYFLIKFSLFVNTNEIMYNSRPLLNNTTSKSLSTLNLTKFSISNIVKSLYPDADLDIIHNRVRSSQKIAKKYFSDLIVQLPELEKIFDSQDDFKVAFIALTLNNPDFNNQKNLITIIKLIVSNKHTHDEKSFLLDQFNNIALSTFFKENLVLSKLRLEYEYQIINYFKLLIIDDFNKL
ncbi:MAG: hypothetical protein ACRDDH_20190 [Cetobacterium sp.]|uniref:hypothetical protein n=1 Tax=Cetobacterium sp. TaxID=2071632 RepID=UPI003EE7402A